eukprot:scaffold20.g7873.t1
MLQGGSSFSDEARRAAAETQRRVRDFVEEQRVAERLRAAADNLQQTVERTARRLDETYELRARAEGAAAAVEREAQRLESKTGVWRKLRAVAKDFVRTWPARRRRLQNFLNTPLGAAALFLVFFLLLRTGWFWRLLSWLFLLSWLAPLALLPLVARQQQEAVERLRRQQEEEMRRRQNPFANVEDLLAGRFRGTRRGGPGGGAAAGDVIDVSYTTVDDDRK